MTKRLIIHAGTHKTASTYIQDRLFQNRLKLNEHGIIYSHPYGKKTFKALASDICKGEWKSLKKHLNFYKNEGKHILISAEQFAVPLNDPKTLRNLQKLALKKGFELEIIIYIRTQLDYINSRYTYSLRRFYHSKSFEEFLAAAIDGRLPGESRERGTIRKRKYLFDFWSYFQPLLEARRQGLKLQYIPFRAKNQDPFDQFLEELSLPVNDSWTQGSHRSHNRSPGIRGVWLAHLLSRKLQEQGINPRSIEGSSKIILKEEAWRGWNDPSFWGFNSRLARSTYTHFQYNNELFAKEVWGYSWEQAFPQDRQHLERKRCSYRPLSLHEELRMHAIADHLVRMIDHRCHPQPWYFISDSVEKLLSRLNPTLVA